jgi:replicative DNA helicase
MSARRPPTGFSMLDRALGGGLKDGKVIVLGARPSVGKTSLGQQIALAVARQPHGSRGSDKKGPQ